MKYGSKFTGVDQICLNKGADITQELDGKFVSAMRADNFKNVPRIGQDKYSKGMILKFLSPSGSRPDTLSTIYNKE